MRVSSLIIISLFAVVPATTAAQGGPPLITDDPATPGPGRWELNAALTLEHNPGESTYEIPLLDLNYGVGDRIQLKLELPVRVVASRESPTLTGLGNSLVGIKWRFYDRKDGWAVSTYPQLEVNNPTSSVRRGVADPGKRFLLPVEIAKSWNAFALNAEAGYELVQDGADALSYGIAIGYSSRGLELLSECTSSSDIDLAETGVLCSLGGRYGIGEQLTGLLAIGWGVTRPNTREPELRCYLGLQRRW